MTFNSIAHSQFTAQVCDATEVAQRTNAGYKKYYKLSSINSSAALYKYCLLLVVIGLLSCGEKKQPAVVLNDANTDTAKFASINKAMLLLQDGDLVERSDDDFESLSLQNFSQKDATYSHSGIAFKEGEQFVVYHAMAGPENPSGSLRRDSFSRFVNPAKKTGFGIFRYDLEPAEINKLHTLYKQFYSDKLPFDKSFNLANSDSMYCSEIIYKALKQSTNNRIVLPTSVLTNYKPKMNSRYARNVFFKKFEFVALDDLYLNDHCKKITAVHY